MVNISIIIPVYNVAPYIEACLNSVMRQTYSGEIECLIVDDCGTDESISITERLIAEYDGPIRFVILHHDYNRGLSAARNTGIEKAVGEYIFFIDSDDEITDDCLEKMMTLVRNNPGVEIVQGTHIYHDQRGETTLVPKAIRISHACTNDEVRNCFYTQKQIPMAAWNKMMKRSVIIENGLCFMEGLLYEDYLWTFYWLKYIKEAYFLSDITYHYKIRPRSILTGTAHDTLEVHKLRGYHEIFFHLTSGYEKEEIEQNAPLFVELFLRHAYNKPELKEDFLVLWQYARNNRQWKRCVDLGFCYIFSKYKWLGKCAFSIQFRLKHPSQIPNDFIRLWHWIKS